MTSSETEAPSSPATSSLATSSPSPSEWVTASPEAAFRWPVALVGALIAAFGISGLIDDSGLIAHPWWVVVVIGAVACCALGVVSTLRSLAHPAADKTL